MHGWRGGCVWQGLHDMGATDTGQEAAGTRQEKCVCTLSSPVCAAQPPGPDSGEGERCTVGAAQQAGRAQAHSTQCTLTTHTHKWTRSTHTRSAHTPPHTHSATLPHSAHSAHTHSAHTSTQCTLSTHTHSAPPGAHSHTPTQCTQHTHTHSAPPRCTLSTHSHAVHTQHTPSEGLRAQRKVPSADPSPSSPAPTGQLPAPASSATSSSSPAGPFEDALKLHECSAGAGTAVAPLPVEDQWPSPPTRRAPIAPTEEQLRQEPWYHGQMSRRAAEKLLRADGDFLVRDSVTNPGQYVLTGMHAGQPKHLLLVDPEGVVRTKDVLFESISHLIDYHLQNGQPIVAAESELHLRGVVKREP
nr:SHC-transforming protein 2 isoform X4 [Vulpes vulpes]